MEYKLKRIKLFGYANGDDPTIHQLRSFLPVMLVRHYVPLYQFTNLRALLIYSNTQQMFQATELMSMLSPDTIMRSVANEIDVTEMLLPPGHYVVQSPSGFEPDEINYHYTLYVLEKLT